MSNSLPTTKKTNLLFSTKNKRRKWTDDETQLFLECFLLRQHEFFSRKKIYAYKNVLKDMIAQGFQDKNVTQSTLENKMKTMYRAFRNYKDNVTPKASNCIAPFMETLESIFEKQPDSLQLSTNNSEKDELIKSENVADEMDSFTQSDIDDPLQDNEKVEEQTINTPTVTQDSNVFENLTTNPMKSAQLEYYETKLEYKRRALAMKAKFYSEMKDLFKEKFQREEAMEKEKLKLLAKIAEKLCKS